MEEMELLREEIDKLDKELVYIFEKRMNIVFQIANLKKEKGLDIVDSEREKMVIEKGKAMLRNKDLEKQLEDFLKALMKISVEIQKS